MALTIDRVTIRESAAKSLGLLHSFTCNTNTVSPHSSIICPTILDLAIDNERFQYAYLWKSAGEWRQVDTVDRVNATFVLSRGFAAQVNVNAVLKAYGTLTPDDWDEACDEGLEDKFYLDRVGITLVADQREYNISNSANWIQTQGQIGRMRFRYLGDGSTKPQEQDLPVAYAFDTDHVVKVIVPAQADVANTTLQVEARHYYKAPFTNDASTITLPSRLAIAAVRYAALKKIFQRLGVKAKQIFGQSMVLCEKELAEEEARWMPRSAQRDWQSEEDPLVGNHEAVSWAW